MTILRLDRRGDGHLDLALAAIDAVTLARTPAGAFAEVPHADVQGLTRALALAGVAAVPCEASLEPAPGLHPAAGRDLSPLIAGAVALDLVRLRRLPLAESTREALRRDWHGLRPPSREGRERCRSLLRGEDAAFAWTRQAWATAAALRTRTVRAVLRPIVFDRAALERASEGRTYGRDGLLGKWLF